MIVGQIAVQGPKAKEILLRNLEPENLGRQCFIGKQDVADRVIKGFEEIDWGRL